MMKGLHSMMKVKSDNGKLQVLNELNSTIFIIHKWSTIIKPIAWPKKQTLDKHDI